MVSIIIPVYNREDYLEECISSVFAQTYKDFEIILIDDGSTDNTLSICQSLIEKDERIKLIKQEHGGVSNARNSGLSAANGEYVFFLDSDDVIHPFLLEALTSALDSTGAGMAGSAVANVPPEYWHMVSEKCSEEISKEWTLHTFDESIELACVGGTPISVLGGVMMRRDLICDTKFRSDFYIGEDFLFIYENLIKETSTVFLNKKLYYVRLHENNSSWDYNYSGFHNRFKRREFVWKSEEKFGRVKNANAQKRGILGCFRMCVKEHKPYDDECKKMRKLMKENKKVLFPAFSKSDKLKYFLGVYFPYLYSIYVKK